MKRVLGNLRFNGLDVSAKPLDRRVFRIKSDKRQGSKLAGARVHGAPRNLAVHLSF